MPSADKRVKVRYFAISPLRLAIYSILSFSLYDIYWFYRQWKAIQKVDDRVRHPVWRAIFSIFYCYSLFRHVSSAGKWFKINRNYSPGLLAFIYIILGLSSTVWARAPGLPPGVEIGVWALVALIFVPLAYTQSLANAINAQQNYRKKDPTSAGATVLIIIGALFSIAFFAAILTTKYLPPDEQQQVDELFQKTESLKQEYDNCIIPLNQRYDALDQTDQIEIDAYNAEYDRCESIREEQNATVDEYSKLTE
ncbi:MAG: hypothetical protein WD887_01955 [Candidatus Saccharimonadales bacterium]